MKISLHALLGFLVFAGLFSSMQANAQPVNKGDFQLNDTFYNRQWYMDFIHAPQAWEVEISSERQVVVAQIDGGIDDSHPDLKGILWEDPDEPIDGKDNDGDGYVDDAHGWNFVLQSEDTRPIARKYGNEAWEHGTIVASLIGARGNDDIGIAGLAWNVKIMPLVILDSDGLGGTDNLVKAIDYAMLHRVDIINMSLEGNSMDEKVADAIKRATAQGILVVIAAGNGYDAIGFNFDDMPLFPACHKGAANQSVLVVTALSSDGTKYESANFGDCVNIAAPGHDLFAARPSYDPDGNHTDVSGYGTWSGTSLSAPLVTGVAAILKAQHPTWTGEQLARRILDTAQPFIDPDMKDAGLGVGVLDAGSAVQPADAKTYGPWQLLAANPGQPPLVYIQDLKGNEIYTIQAGDSGDTRGLRAAFVRWDDDRYPEIIVSTIGDTKGAWRVFRTDGVLLAAGQVAQDGIIGGLSISTQDLYAENRDVILLSEAAGSRAWEITPEEPTAEPIVVVEKPDPLGVIAVGLQRPSQSFVILGRAKNQSQLATLDYWSFNDGTYVETPHPENLSMTSALTIDNRELLSFVQSGKPSYMIERGGGLKIVETAKVWRYLQAPLGIEINKQVDRLLYDTWPR